MSVPFRRTILKKSLSTIGISPEIVFSPCAVQISKGIYQQTYWWIFVTLLVLAATVIPSILLARGVDVIELQENLLISFGIRATAALSSVFIDKMFKVINQSNLTFPIRGKEFFTVDNPLHQFMSERSILAIGRKAGIRPRRDQMASHKFVWLILILCSFIVKVCPDFLGASLISQNVPQRVADREIINLKNDTILAPDFGVGDRTMMTRRGNCNYYRAGKTNQRSGLITKDRFGFLIFQYCVDILVEDRVLLPSRTLVGRLGNKDIQARFHIEAITESVFSEDWVPFSNKTHAQGVLDELLSQENICPSEECVQQFQGDFNVLIYRILDRVGLLQRRLVGDDESFEKLSSAQGKVVQRLSPSTKASFSVLVGAVVLFSLFSAVSNNSECTTVRLQRAIGELRKTPGISFATAVALHPRDDGDDNLRWSKMKGTECYVLYPLDQDWNDVKAALPGTMEVVLIDEEVNEDHKVAKILADVAHLGILGDSSDVRDLVPS